MILVDFSQVAFGHIAMEVARTNMNHVDPDYIRHMIYNQLRALNVQFRGKYGQMYMVYDSSSWRSKVFEHYKGARKKDRAKSLLDWNQIFEVIEGIKNDIHEHLPWPVFQAQGAEADDIIGYICSYMGSQTEILIISSDKDFKQLQHFKGVKQWRPTTDEYLVEKKPLEFLREMLIVGDKGDGIPNVLSPLDIFMQTDANGKPKRQKVMTGKRLEELRGYVTVEVQPFSEFPSASFSLDCPQELRERIELNEKLISLVNPAQNIPANVRRNIKAAISEAKPKSPDVFFYLASVGCNQLSTKAADFFPA